MQGLTQAEATLIQCDKRPYPYLVFGLPPDNWGFWAIALFPDSSVLTRIKGKPYQWGVCKTIHSVTFPVLRNSRGSVPFPILATDKNFIRFDGSEWIVFEHRKIFSFTIISGTVEEHERLLQEIEDFYAQWNK